MGILGWIFFILLIVGGAAYLVVIGNRTLRNQDDQADPLLQRLAEFSERGEQVSLEQLEMSQPFNERVLIPFLRRVGEISARFTPQKLLLETNRRLEQAGNPGRIDAATLLAARFIVPVIFIIIIFILSSLLGPWPTSNLVGAIGFFGLMGFLLPQSWLSNKIKVRQNEIRKAMPDALDLLTICVEAGLSFDSAMAKVSEKWENQLSLAFGRTIREVQLGKTRREALRDMSDRIGLSEMTSFIAAVIQSEQLGVSMAKVLRIQSEQMRVKRRQRAEELAHQAPIKMIFPMGLLIFPSILIVLLTPAVLSIITALGGVGQ